MQSKIVTSIALIALLGSLSIMVGVTLTSNKDTPKLSKEVYQKVLKLSEKKMAYLDSLILINEELFKSGTRKENDYEERKKIYGEIKDQECKLIEFISDIHFQKNKK